MTFFLHILLMAIAMLGIIIAVGAAIFFSQEKQLAENS